MKAAVTTDVLLTADRLSRRNRVAAVGLMVALNSTYAVIVARNYRF